MHLHFRRRGFTQAEVLLFIITIFLAGVFAYYSARADLMEALVDQSSHLNFSRLTFDSLTPGISQIGFWPPLLHFLMMPFVAIRPLYESGFAGIFVLVPALLASVFIIHRLTFKISGNRFLSLIAGLLLLMNPYMLYYTVTPMMEVLFLMNLFAVAYCMFHWIQTGRISSLLWTGVFISLASLSRFEGLILIPLVSVLVAVKLISKRKKYAEIEAIMLLFGLLAIIGLGFVVVYSWQYSGDPLAFSGGSWLRNPTENLRLTRLNPLTTLQYLLHASFYMLGQPFVWIALLSALLMVTFTDQRFSTVSILLILLSPFLFVALSLLAGSIVINVPELTPYGFFNNERYGLTWIGFAVLAPLLFLASLRRRWRHLNSPYLGIATNSLALLIVALSAYHMYEVTLVTRFPAIRYNINVPTKEQKEVAKFLAQNYEGGKVLMVRVDNDPVIANAKIPLKNYIYEGNFRYFDQALREPWNFAEWVIMHNPTRIVDTWAQLNEPIFREWGVSNVLPQYYDLVFENAKRRVYRLNREKLRRIVVEKGYNVNSIPSLNPKLERWDPQTIYASMKIPIRRSEQDLPSRKTIRKELVTYYGEHLQPVYASGYYLNAQGEGNSESQSYALWQAFVTNDQQTFSKVWTWTKRNIQRPDSLFNWKFSMDKNRTLKIDDAHAATDADTDIAYMLLQAGRQWSKPTYIEEAKKIISSIWEHETAIAAGRRHVIAGTWAKGTESIVVNPSYFSPYAYRLFASYDRQHDWNALISQGYRDVTIASQRTIGSNGAMFLPPNWAEIEIETGEFRTFKDKQDSGDYSYDAFRTFFRVSLDELLSHNADASTYLAKSTTFDREMQTNSRVCSVYLFKDNETDCQRNFGAYAAPLSVWTVTNPRLASEFLRDFYLPDGTIDSTLSLPFYDRSWYWFSLWLWSNTPEPKST